MALEGKVVIVTGAARGIGQEYVRALAAAGALPVAADVNDCAETVDLAKAAGGQALSVCCDITDANSTNAMAASALEAFGRIDGLVNNAALYGGLRGGRFESISEADWDASMSVNVKGIWNCCKSVVPAMRASGGGSIINVASLAATFGTPFVLHYTTSKAAVIGMTRGLARELGHDSIRVNAVAPSAVITEGTREFFANKFDKALDVVKAGQAIQRNLHPRDLSGTILWLLADSSAFVTGQTISVDGGTVMN
ncbi:SDR family NAD(P)-dependent oxidoreductase [Nitratireductor alexandrii]|uniref:SDR family NAD(P)-dependent oxidoreductase n=1 Tax=Nitratireductor alexandrii TaxID=2448161 RepID=UPI0013DF986E|nr:SDR family oxidoreductase [Nitratireductor alexandrii]